MLGCDAWRGVSHRLRGVVQPILRPNNKPQQTEHFKAQELVCLKQDLHTAALMIGRSCQFRELAYLRRKSVLSYTDTIFHCIPHYSPVRGMTCDCKAAQYNDYSRSCSDSHVTMSWLAPFTGKKNSWIQGIGAPLLNEARGVRLQRLHSSSTVHHFSVGRKGQTGTVHLLTGR